MIKSPLAYFGNRGELQEDIFHLIEQHKNQKAAKFRRCYDLFAGSASMSLQAIALNLADEYIINDVYGALAHFWEQVKAEPKALIAAYRQIKAPFDCHVDKPSAYQEIQARFNEKRFENAAEQAALFAVIINHAKGGQPLLDQTGQRLSCEYAAGHSQAEASEFDSLVQKLHQALTKDGIKVSFHAKNFTDFHAEEITAADLVLLDPPYPDMLDAEEMPEQHIYHRPESKSVLHTRLQEFVQYLQQHAIPFLMFYGVQGMDNPCPLQLPEQHYLRMAGGLNHPYGEYVENVYVAKLFIPYLKAVYLPRLLRWDLSLAESIIKEPTYQAVAEWIKNKISEYAVWNQPFPLLLEHVAQERSLYPALVLNDGTKISYGALNEEVNRLAQYLKVEYGIKPGNLVGIVVGEMKAFVISILALWKLRAAYVPVSAQEQDQVIKETLAASQARVCLVTGACALPELNIPAIDFPCAEILSNYDKTAPDEMHTLSPDDLAYVMYTSGTTGKPKGAAILHKGLPYCIKAHQDILQLTPNARIAQMAKVGFDASLMEILMALGSGASLYFIEPDIRDNNDRLTAFFNTHEISQAILVPSKLKTLHPKDFPRLKGLIVTGERFDEALVQPWLKDRIIVNGYGLTETTICTTLGRYEGDGLTIGKPIIGTKIYLKGTAKEPEIYIAGMSLAKGYWQDQARSQERFVEIEDPELQQKVLAYRSGDIGNRLANGEYQVIGRLDNQLKLRGQRLEPEHIETKLKSYRWNNQPIIKEACVVGTAIGDDHHLVAYLVKTPQLAAQAIPVTEIHRYLKTELPGFMVPNAIAWQEALPLSNNGKIDRKALATHRPVPFISSAQQIRPKTPVEQAIAQCWSEVLDCDVASIYREDDFFCLGGSSVKISALLKKLIQRFPSATPLQPAELYDYSRLDQLARLMSASPLTALNHRPSAEQRLYLVHSLLGDGWSEYQALANQLPFTVYAYRARGLDEPEERVTSLPELARDYIDELLRNEARLQQHQTEAVPLVIAGWSSGGLVAVEMAKQLKQRGHAHVNVILLDTDYPQTPDLNDVIELGRLLARQRYQAEPAFNQQIDSTALAETFSARTAQVFTMLDALKPSRNKANPLGWIQSFYQAEAAYCQQWQPSEDLPLYLMIAQSSAAKPRQWPACHASQIIANTHHFNLLENHDCQRQLTQRIENSYLDVASVKLLERLKARYRRPILRRRWLTGEEWEVNQENCLMLNLQEVAEKQPSSRKVTTINYPDLLGEKYRRAALQGAAGTGKTILTELLAVLWSRGQLWQAQKFTLVLRLPLRRLSGWTEKNLSLAKAVYYEYLGETMVSSELQLLERLLDTQAQKIAWVLDGFDEVAHFYHGPSPLGTILKMLLSQPYVLVTSRFGYAEQLESFAKIENKALSSDAADAYLQRIARQDGLELKALASEIPALQPLFKVPLLLELLVSLYQQKQLETEAETLTQAVIYQKMTALLVKADWRPQQAEGHTRFSYGSLIEQALQTLAFNSFYAHQSTSLTGQDIAEVSAELCNSHNAFLEQCRANAPIYLRDNLPALQLQADAVAKWTERCALLLQTSYARHTENKRYDFIHLSFQEYLVACYWVARFQENAPDFALLKDERWDIRYEAIWLFTAGLLREHYSRQPRVIERWLGFFVSTSKEIDELSWEQLCRLILYWIETGRPVISVWGNHSLLDSFKRNAPRILSESINTSGQLHLLVKVVKKLIVEQQVTESELLHWLSIKSIGWIIQAKLAPLLACIPGVSCQNLLQWLQMETLRKQENVQFALAEALAQRKGVTTDNLLQWLQMETLEKYTQYPLAEVLAQRPEATKDNLLQWLQIGGLGWDARYPLAEALVQRLEATKDNLLQWLQMETLQKQENVLLVLAKALAQRPEATKDNLLQWLQMETLQENAQFALAKVLAQRYDVTTDNLLQWLQIETLKWGIQYPLAEALAQRKGVTTDNLLQWLQIETLGWGAQYPLVKALAQRQEATKDNLLEWLQIETLKWGAQYPLAEALAQHPETTSGNLLQTLQIETLGPLAQYLLENALFNQHGIMSNNLPQELADISKPDNPFHGKLTEDLKTKTLKRKRDDQNANFDTPSAKKQRVNFFKPTLSFDDSADEKTSRKTKNEALAENIPVAKKQKFASVTLPNSETLIQHNQATPTSYRQNEYSRLTLFGPSPKGLIEEKDIMERKLAGIINDLRDKKLIQTPQIENEIEKLQERIAELTKKLDPELLQANPDLIKFQQEERKLFGGELSQSFN